MRLLIALGGAVLPVFVEAKGDGNDAYIRQALGRYFSLPQDARSLSTAGTRSLTCDDANCLYMNPAGLGRLQDVQLAGSVGKSRMSGDEFLTDESIEQDELRGYGVLAVPLGAASSTGTKYGALALGFSRYQGETSDRINTTPDGHRRSIAYGIELLDDVTAGYSFTFYDDQLRSDLADLHSHARFLHTFGAQLQLANGIMLGGIFKLGIGQSDTEDFRFLSNGLSYLREYAGSLGATKEWEKTLLSVAIDYRNVQSKGNLTEVSPSAVIGGDESGNEFNVRLGLEHEVLERLFVRLGGRYYRAYYRFDRTDLRELSGEINALGCSTGIGHVAQIGDWKNIRIDYGIEYLTTGRGDWEHMLSVLLPITF
jgi:hypothetical protein